MGLKKGDVVRIIRGTQQIGDFFRVTNTEDKRFVYANMIKGGVTQDKNYYLRNALLVKIPHISVTISKRVMERIKKEYFPDDAIIMEYTPIWQNVIDNKLKNQNLLLRLVTNEKEELWIKFISIVRTTHKNSPTVTLFEAEYV